MVEAADRWFHVFNVTFDYVKKMGLAIKGATGHRRAGIFVGANYCNITNNSIITPSLVYITLDKVCMILLFIYIHIR